MLLGRLSTEPYSDVYVCMWLGLHVQNIRGVYNVYEYMCCKLSFNIVHSLKKALYGRNKSGF
jgi:hypothetical protein